MCVALRLSVYLCSPLSFPPSLSLTLVFPFISLPLSYEYSSYLHVRWATTDKLIEGDKRIEGKVKRYKAKQESMGIFVNVCF